MIFSEPLYEVTLLRRYKRFLADVVLASGEQITVHCPNTGGMRNCIVEGAPAWISDSNNDKRKYRFTWELATTPCGGVACINTHRANALAVEAIEAGRVAELVGYDSLLREKTYGEENSRIDILLERSGERCFIEVKSVTLAEGGERRGYFPDAKSVRAIKHLRELMRVAASGERAVLFFCVQHTGIDSVSPADHIDPSYGIALREAAASGVELLAYRANITSEGMSIVMPVPILLDGRLL